MMVVNLRSLLAMKLSVLLKLRHWIKVKQLEQMLGAKRWKLKSSATRYSKEADEELLPLIRQICSLHSIGRYYIQQGQGRSPPLPFHMLNLHGS